MKRDRFQFSLRLLLIVVLMAALIALALRERAGRQRAEDRARIAEAEARALNVMSIALDAKRIYIWDTERGSLTAISRAKRQIVWEHKFDLTRRPNLLPVSPPEIDGNLVYINDTAGNRVLVLNARNGVLIEARSP